jgi:polynucleotide 5'-hydroxyl-kinase GRC3/NOL9
LFNLRARDARFIGTTSPSSVTEKVKEAMVSLKKEALESNLDYVLVNSDGWIEGDDAVNYKQQLIETINPDIIIGIQKNDELTNLLSTLGKYQKVIVESPQIINQRSREKRKNLRELGYQKYLRNSKLLSFPLGWLKIENGDLLGLTRTRQSIKEARRIYDLLGMKPLHIAEQSDRITIIIGKKRWINAENLKKAEEATKKKVIVVRKGEEEGLLTGLYNSDGKFLGIGVIQEIDYLRKTLKFLTSVSETIATASIGKVKLDKNLKEVPSFDEENQSEFTTFNKLF